MRNTGIAFTVAAVAHLVIGAAVIAYGSSPSEQSCPPGCDNAPGVFLNIGGIIVIAASVAYAAIGVPLWVVGAKRASQPSAASTGEPPRPRVRIEPSAQGFRLVF